MPDLSSTSLRGIAALAAALLAVPALGQSSDCCEANGGQGCDDAACQATVCAWDPFCCEGAWDELCANKAQLDCAACGFANPCGSALAGDCCAANGTPGCDDAECCEAVCLGDFFCCEVFWDDLCAGYAASICAACGAPTGACCLPGGACDASLSAEECAGQGGSWFGAGSSCADAPCAAPDPTGACCLAEGVCTAGVTAAECAAAGGAWLGEGSSCAGSPCTTPDPVGACCLPNGDCAADALEADCVAVGGTWLGEGSSCAAADCQPPDPVGACCFPDGACAADVTEAECAAAGGAWLGAGSSCAGDPCGGGTDPLVAFLDIKPGGCPNSFNTRSNGYLPVALLGTDGFDVGTVDLDSLALARADGVGGSVAPNVGPPGPAPSFGDVGSPGEGADCACGGAPDGWVDLQLKFKRKALTEALGLDQLPSGTSVSLVLTGLTLDGQPFSATDCVVIVP